jgi:AraC-like DNA-binding protein
LQRGDVSLDGVARALGMSGRTLQRHLNAQGTSHRELLDEARSAAALRHLGADTMSVTDVAFVLGFSEVSAFHRAFRRWTGMGPSEFRSVRRHD